MKKFRLSICLTFVLLGGISAFIQHRSQTSSNLSELQLANIEALANEESALPLACATKISYDGSSMVVSCSSCSFKYGYKGTNNSTCIP